MKVGDKVIVRDDCDVLIDERIYVRHGIVSSIISGEPAPWYIIKFADGIVDVQVQVGEVSLLKGELDVIVEHAFIHGFMSGHEFGKMMGQVIPADLEEALEEYKKVLEEDIRGSE